MTRVFDIIQCILARGPRWSYGSGFDSPLDQIGDINF